MDNENLDMNVSDTVNQTELDSNKGSDVEVGNGVDSTNDNDTEEKLPKGLEKRLAKLTKMKYDQQARIEELEAKLRSTQQAPEKSREEFTDDEWIEHLADQKAKEHLQKFQSEQQKAYEQQKQATEAAAQWHKKITSFKEEMPDFQKVVGNADVDLPVDVLRDIAESDVGPRIAYYLAKNTDEAEALVDMNPRQRERFLTKLEIKLENPISSGTKEITKATPTPNGKGKSGGTVNMNNLSMDDWVAMRRKQVHNR